MAHAAAHLKKARELEQNSEYKALQKAREKRRQQRERAERKRQVKVIFVCLRCGICSLEDFGCGASQNLWANWNNSVIRYPLQLHFCFILNWKHSSIIATFQFWCTCCGTHNVWLAVFSKLWWHIYNLSLTSFLLYTTCIEIYCMSCT